MKTKILNAINKQIVFLLSVLGFSLACNQCAAQYGAPIPLNYITGTVKSNEGLPIRNIRIVVQNDSFQEVLPYSSDSSGYFYYYSRKKINGNRIQLKFTDVDGNENGNYLPLDTMVTLKPREEIMIDVIMKKKD